MSLDGFIKASFSECVLAMHLYDPRTVYATHFTRSSLFLVAKADANEKVCVSPFNYFLFQDSKWSGRYTSIGAISDEYSLPLYLPKLNHYDKYRSSYCKIKIRPPITHIFQLFSFTKKYDFSFVKDSHMIDYINEMIIFPILILQKNYPSIFEEFCSTILESVSFLHKYMKKMYRSSSKSSIRKSLELTNKLFVEYIKIGHNAYLEEVYQSKHQMDAVLSKYNQAIDEKVALWKNNN